MPFFSIILPTYNREQYLSRAIESVLAQSFEDWELIVIDDCSTDSTSNILEGYSDSRIRVLRNASNRERSFSRNRGIEDARGEFIAYIDSDDEWLGNHLQVHFEAWEFFEKGTAPGVVITQVERVRDGQKISSGFKPYGERENIAEYILEVQPGPSSWSLSRESALTFSFDPSLYVNEDVVVLTKIAARKGISVIEKITVQYHMHDTNTHRSDRDTWTPQLDAMNVLFGDPSVRGVVSKDVRESRFKMIRHNQCGAVYKFGSWYQSIFVLLNFLLRYPIDPSNFAKVRLLLASIPLLNRLSIISRGAEVVIKHYFR